MSLSNADAAALRIPIVLGAVVVLWMTAAPWPLTPGVGPVAPTATPASGPLLLHDHAASEPALTGSSTARMLRIPGDQSAVRAA